MDVCDRVVRLIGTLSVLVLSACGGGGGGAATNDGVPTAQSFTFTTFVGASASGNLPGYDPDGDTLIYQIVDGSTAGIVTISDPNTGAFTYITNADTDVDTVDVFTYMVSDGEHESRIATVTIRITQPYGVPIANDDIYSSGIAEGGEIYRSAVIGVLANDVDEDYDPLTAVLVSGPSAAASFTLEANGSFRYTHDGSENTIDSFTYMATDGKTFSNVATVAFAISPVNDAPVASNDSAYLIAEGGVMAVAADTGVLANDSDADGDALTAILIAGPSSAAEFSLASNGSFNYTHDGGESTSDSFSYRVNDGESYSDVATVTFTITPVNDAPVANHDLTYALTEGGVLAVDVNTGVLANDADAENNSLSATLISGPASAASFSFEPDGSFSYAHDGSETVSDSFTYVANDGESNSNVATVSVTISQVNDNPVAMESCWATPQEQSLAGVTFDASDEETPGLLMYSIETNGQKGVATIVNATTGEFSYTPFNPGARGVDTITFKVEDPDGGVATGAATVIIDQKVMPLGDSITEGIVDGDDPTYIIPSEERIAYRKKLYDSLVASGYSPDFVGGQSGGSSFLGLDPHHEGHSGWRDDEIAWGSPSRDPNYPDSGIYYWLTQNPADIILLHIGTNAHDSSPTDVADLLDEIDRWEASANGNPVTVIIVRIGDLPPFNGVVTPFNDNVVAMVQTRIINGDDIIIVDNEHTLTYPVDIGVNGHPNQSGYNKMADVWLYPLAGTGTVTGTGVANSTGAYTGTGILDKCP